MPLAKQSKGFLAPKKSTGDVIAKKLFSGLPGVVISIPPSLNKLKYRIKKM